MSKELLNDGSNLVSEASIGIEEVMELFSHNELAEMHLELLDIAKTLEAQVERLFTYAKTLELENKALETMIEKK